MNTLYGEPITSFSGEYRWLSNFWLSDIHYSGRIFPSVENAYQASKYADWSSPDFPDFENITPGQAKRLGNEIPLRDDWDQVKIFVMAFWTAYKYQDVTLAQKLIDTGERPIIEGNTWGDTFWGQSPLGKGSNHLGKILERQRDKLNDPD